MRRLFIASVMWLFLATGLGAQSFTLTHPDSTGIASVAFGRHGELATGGTRGTVVVWDVASKKARFTLDDASKDSVYALAFDPKGQYLASVSEGSKIKIWKLKDGSLLTTLPACEAKGNYLPLAIAISPDGKLLAAGGMSPQAKAAIQVWRTDKFEKANRLEGHEHEITALSFGPNSKFLAAADKKQIINIWNLDASAVSRSINTRHANIITTVHFKHDWTLLSCADNKMRTWDPRSGMELATLFDGANFNKGTVETAAWSPDGKLIAFSQIDGLGGKILLYDVKAAKVVDPKFILPKHVTRLAWDPEGWSLAVGSVDGTVSVFGAKKKIDVYAGAKMVKAKAGTAIVLTLGNIYDVQDVVYRCDNKDVFVTESDIAAKFSSMVRLIIESPKAAKATVSCNYQFGAMRETQKLEVEFE